MRTIVLIANALTLIGSLLLTVSGLIKSKKSFLVAQCGMNLLFVTSNVLLGGYSGAIVNGVNFMRNLVTVKGKLTKPLKLVIIVIQVSLTAILGVSSAIMWLPVIGNSVFTWVMDTEDMVLLKSVFGVTQIIWAIYDLTIMNYAGVPFDVAALITASIAIAALLKERKAVQKQDN